MVFVAIAVAAKEAAKSESKSEVVIVVSPLCFIGVSMFLTLAHVTKNATTKYEKLKIIFSHAIYCRHVARNRRF